MEYLAPQFVRAMHTLFDLLDEQQDGYLLVSEFEKRWQRSDNGDVGETTKHLPKDFIKFLLDLHSEQITFPLFCHALHNCLSHHRNQQRNVDENQKKLLQQQGPPKPPRLHRLLPHSVTDLAVVRSDDDPNLRNWFLNDRKSDCNRKMDVADANNLYFNQQQQKQLLTNAKVAIRRREPRRHTLQNGIDSNLMKRSKQLDQEKEILLFGVQMINRVHCWYTRQLQNVGDKIRELDTMAGGGRLDPWTESHQERFELQKARIFDVNRHLQTLMDTWDRQLPFHMNLAVRPIVLNNVPSINQQQQQQQQQLQQQHHNELILNSKLRQQNGLLLDELQRKNDRIAMLEKEKVSLIRELLHLRSQFYPGNHQQLINNSCNDEVIF